MRPSGGQTAASMPPRNKGLLYMKGATAVSRNWTILGWGAFVTIAPMLI
ncbi:hypothetical protein Z949_131 [Sulfitobacter guttiformis KCTC 32187]|nr:hypothetical protein Z949_131 [Sulfitobacter guttiformis KCTC 32187]